MEITKWLESLELDTSRWLIAAAIVVLSSITFPTVKRVLLSRVLKRNESYSLEVIEFIRKIIAGIKRYFMFGVSLYLGTFALDLSPNAHLWSTRAIVVLGLLQAAALGSIAIEFWMERYLRSRGGEDAATATTLGLLRFLARAVLYTLIFLLILNNLGVNITALVAGLGVGGVAVALALQNVLGDLFGSLSIVLDKPFIIGDFIVVGEFSGTIEHIGLKTTRIRSLSGEQLIFSNADLLQSRIRNFKRMRERRVVMNLAVTYDTAPAKLEAIPGWIRELVGKQERARFDRCHFLRFKDAWLEFEIVYWVTDSAFEVHADLAHALNISIIRKFGDENVEFAFPTQTLYLRRDPVPASPKNV